MTRGRSIRRGIRKHPLSGASIVVNDAPYLGIASVTFFQYSRQAIKPCSNELSACKVHLVLKTKQEKLDKIETLIPDDEFFNILMNNQYQQLSKRQPSLSSSFLRGQKHFLITSLQKPSKSPNQHHIAHNMLSSGRKNLKLECTLLRE